MAKNIIITGAKGNLGSAVVSKFLQEGHRVIAIDRGESPGTADSAHPLFTWITADLSEESLAQTVISDLLRSNERIDAALLLVGGFAMGTIQTTSGQELRRMFTLNFETAYFISRLLFPHMIANGYGRLVFIGARPALQPEDGKNMVAYSLSKSLLFTLADLINAEAKGKNVVAAVLVPSTLDTELNRKDMPGSDPSNWVKPGQVATILEFICSENASVLRESVYKAYNNA
jgi:NAD(P)-dependent dehydrogenase (short-subunit alcohol dehydrogenase family)